MKKLKLILSCALLIIGTFLVTAQSINTNNSYRLTNTFLKEGRCLDVMKASDKPFMGNSGNYTGQYWVLKHLGGNKYSINDAYGRVLDVRQNSNKPFMGSWGGYTGQFWTITANGNGTYKIIGAYGRALDNNGGKDNYMVMRKPQNVTGQSWKFTNLGAASPPFHMLFAADPQYPWSDDNVSRTDDEKNTYSETMNTTYIKSINKHATEIGTSKVKGLIINGDLTAYGHGWQMDKFDEMYKKVTIPLFLGLGNHDYANNVDNCWRNRCAFNMVDYMRDHIEDRNYLNYDYKSGKGSLAYSWDEGKVHFVQLHNFPTYTTEISRGITRTVEITSSLAWLEADLKKAKSAGQFIILNFHDSDQHWSDNYSTTEVAQNSRKFRSLIDTYNVSAVFVGHYHSRIGKDSNPRPNNVSYGNIPIIYCGAPTYNRYLSVKFDAANQKMVVTQINSTGGNAAASMGSVKTYTLKAN